MVVQRIHVTGSSCSGKSTTAARLATALSLELVELDALNWLPNWVGLNEIDPARFETRITEATVGDKWVLAGSYESWCRKLCWDRLDTIVWLDLPRWLLLVRVIRRSWRRARTKELLWGTNYERFWPQLKFWNQQSLVWWIWNHYQPKRDRMIELMSDPQYAQIKVIRLTSVKEIDAFLQRVEQTSNVDLETQS